MSSSLTTVFSRQEPWESYAKMFAKNYDPSRGRPSTFIYKSAKLALMGLASNYKKKSGRTQIQAVLFDLDKPAPEPEQDQLDNLDRSAVFCQLSEAVQCLEPRTKTILDIILGEVQSPSFPGTVCPVDC